MTIDKGTLYEGLVDKLPGMVWAGYMDAKGAFHWLHLSDALLELYGLTREEFERDVNVLATRVHPEDLAAYAAAGDRAARFEGPFSWRGRIVRGEGDVRFVRSQAHVESHPALGQLWFGQSFDETEQERAHRELVAAQEARAASESMLRTVLDSLPVSVAVLDQQGRFVLFNEATKRMTGVDAADGIDSLSQTYGTFEPDGVTRVESHTLPIVRALAGETVLEREVLVRNRLQPEGALLSISGIPLRKPDGAVWAGLALSHDVTATRRLEQEVRQRNAELLASEEAKSTLIERLRYAVDELSTPILEVWDDVLVVPLIGVIDSKRMADLVQKLLSEVARTQTQAVIVDLTGVDLVDTRTADHLLKLVRKVELVGASCVLTGIQPNVAQTLVDIGVDFGRLTTLRSLKHGLRLSLDRGREQAAAPRAAAAG